VKVRGNLRLHFLNGVILKEYSLQHFHHAIGHVIAQHAGMDDKLDVIFFIRPHDVIARFFDSLGKENQKSNWSIFVDSNG